MNCLPNLRLTAALLATLVLGACAWLPDAQQVEQKAQAEFPDWLIQEDGQLLAPEDARRRLRQLLQSLSDPQPMLRHLVNEQHVAGTPLVTGNSVRLLIDGAQTYPRMLKALQAAEQHIHLNSYIFSEKGIGGQMAEIMMDRARKGLDVRLIHDAIGALDTPDDFFQRLADAGVQVLRFNPVDPVEDLRIWRLNHREHAKLLTVDGTLAFTGGINISSVYSADSGAGSSYRPLSRRRARSVADQSWRDTHLEIAGPVVPYLQQRFLNTVQTITGKPVDDTAAYLKAIKPTGSVALRMLDSQADDDRLPAYSLYLSAAEAARQRLWITQAYFSPNDELIDALMRAAERGVDVRILLPGVTDQALLYHASRASYGRLLKAGVQLWEYQDRVLHAKTAVMDGVWSTIGSANLDVRSFIHNNELNVTLLDAGFAAQMERQFELDVESARAVSLDEWRARPLSDRLKEAGARLINYWL